MGDYGFKVSQPGYDVGTAEIRNLVYSSEYDTFKVYAFGAGTITASTAAATTLVINHNMNYRPAFAFYTQIFDVFVGTTTTEYNMAPYSDPVGGDASIIPYVGTADLRVRFGRQHAPNGTPIRYKYFLYYNQAR